MKQFILNVNKLDNSELYNALKTCKYPIDWVSDHLWTSWTSRITNNKYKACKMRFIANCLDMDWPLNKNKEKAIDYELFPWTQLMRCPLQLQKKIIKCIAAITLVNLNQTEMAVEYLKFFDNYRNNKEGRVKFDCDNAFEIDKLMKSDYFEEIYCSDDPIILLSKEMWSDWASHLTISKFRTYEVKSIADFLGLDWPAGRKDDLVSDYILVDLPELAKMSLPLRKILIVCIAAIIATEKNMLKYKLLIDVSTRNYGNFNGNVEKYIRELVVSVDPENLVTQDLWEEWSFVLSNKGLEKQTIYKYAKKNGYIWPKSKQEETFEYYLAKTFHEITKIHGDATKRTIILCVAKAANSTNVKHN